MDQRAVCDGATILGMKGYGQFCPVAQTMEIIGERWTLLVVRELLCGSRRFNELMRGVPLMSRTMLSQRLRTLEDAGIVVRSQRGTKGHEYTLTPAGEELRTLVEQCGMWGQRWARREARADDLDAGLLMWDMQRNIRLEVLPEERVTVEFRFRGAARGQGRFWLVLDGQPDLCLTRPGFEVDLVVQTHLRTMTLIWLGDIAFGDALKSGELGLEGPSSLKRALPSWLKLSAFAGVARPCLAARSRR
jgi:DNA-binding HxlR family transcriptional regulator